MNDSLKNHSHSNPSVSYSENNGILPRSDSYFDHKKYLNSKQIGKVLDSRPKKIDDGQFSIVWAFVNCYK